MQHASIGFGGWAVIIFGLVLALLGAPILAGGVWLAALGGSFYYVLAGLGLIAAGILLMRRRAAGAWLYGLVFIATLIWAYWEVGLDGWALVPRVAGPAVLAVILLLLTPALRRQTR